MSNFPKITALRLQETVRYDPMTGIFTNMIDRGKKAKEGQEFGFLEPTGYMQTRIDNRTYRLHQLAWLYMWAQWPEGVIDHVNGNKADNRFCNLRDVPQRINTQNQRRASKRSKLGILGVSQVEGVSRFSAQIKYDGKVHRLGTFPSIESASSAYLAAKRQHHEGNTL